MCGEGITKLSATDIKYAEQLGYRIRLLGIAKRQRLLVLSCAPAPTLVPQRRLIANVEGAMNAVMVQGDAVGTTMYYGKGAGSGAHRFGCGGLTWSTSLADRCASGPRAASGFPYDSMSACRSCRSKRW